MGLLAHFACVFAYLSSSNDHTNSFDFHKVCT